MRREYEDDDGRTIADMSDLPDVSIVGRWSGIHKDNAENGGLFGAFGAFGRGGAGGYGAGGYGSSGYGGAGGRYGGGRSRHEIPASEMDSSERRMYVLCMLKASLGIGMIYVLAFAVIVGALVLIW